MVSPVTPVPLIVGVVSFVGLVIVFMTGAIGAVLSISSDCPVDKADWFPALSVAFAVIVYVPSLIADGVMDHVPPETTTVPRMVVP